MMIIGIKIVMKICVFVILRFFVRFAENVVGIVMELGWVLGKGLRFRSLMRISLRGFYCVNCH